VRADPPSLPPFPPPCLLVSRPSFKHRLSIVIPRHILTKLSFDIGDM
jgi:hypothetical protein